MREIVLYGWLRRFCGARSFSLAVASPAEAVQALCANFPGLRQRIGAPGMRFAVFSGRENITEEGLLWQGSQPIKLVPVAEGAGKFFNIIAGAVLIIVTAVVDYFTFGEFSAITQYSYIFGASLILGGLSQLLVPTPKASNTKEQQNQDSFAFNGPVNVTAQGAPVPLFYGGPAIVGSVVVSAGISVGPIPVGQSVDPTEPEIDFG